MTLAMRHCVAERLRGQERDPVQNTVDSPTQLEPVRPRLEVEIAGPGRPRLCKSLLHRVGRIARTRRVKLREHFG